MEVREWYEFAYKCGRSFQSDETHFIHYHPHRKDAKSIPVYENLLFVLALFRTKTLEHIQEGKTLLKKLLNFQSESFPTYLHEYPMCYDRQLPAKVLVPLFWIYKDFQKVLGDDLEKDLESCIQKIKSQMEVPLGSVFSPDKLSDRLAFLQMHPESKEFKDLLDEAQTVWHDKLSDYVGPAVQLNFFEHQIKPSYFLYFQKYLQGMSPPKELSIWGLSAALLPQDSLHMPVKTYPFEQKFNDMYWYQDEHLGFSVNTSAQGYPFYLVVGSYSAVLDLPHAHLKSYLWKKPKLELEIEVDTTASQHKEKEAVLSLYFLRKDNSQIFVEGKKATAFKLNQNIEIQMPKNALSLSFSKKDGDSQFFGHIVQGNRPSQMDEQNFYDHEVCLRTVQGEKPSTVVCTIVFH